MNPHLVPGLLDLHACVIRPPVRMQSMKCRRGGKKINARVFCVAIAYEVGGGLAMGERKANPLGMHTVRMRVQKWRRLACEMAAAESEGDRNRQ